MMSSDGEPVKFTVPNRRGGVIHSSAHTLNEIVSKEKRPDAEDGTAVLSRSTKPAANLLIISEISPFTLAWSV